MPFLLTRQWLTLLPMPVTAFIDLDSCTMYGNDFNDLVTIMQLIGHPRHVILSVMRKLLNPAMAKAIQRLEACGHSVRVCVYTRKSNLLNQTNGDRFRAPNGDLYFPAATHSGEVSNNSHNSFNRLFYTRQIIGEALGRKDIEMVVTKNPKSVSDTCLHTLVPPVDPSRAFLYDDNEEYKDAIVVPPFDAISEVRAELVLGIVGREPVDEIIANRVKKNMHDYYYSLEEDNRLSIAITSKPVLDWPLPAVCQTNTVSVRQHLEAATRGYVAAVWRMW